VCHLIPQGGRVKRNNAGQRCHQSARNVQFTTKQGHCRTESQTIVDITANNKRALGKERSSVENAADESGAESRGGATTAKRDVRLRLQVRVEGRTKRKNLAVLTTPLVTSISRRCRAEVHSSAETAPHEKVPRNATILVRDRI
jgi:hypothetical protein